MGFYGILWVSYGKCRNSAAFPGASRRRVHGMFSYSDPVDKSVVRENRIRITQPAAWQAIESASRLSAAPASRWSTPSRSASATTVARPFPTRQRATRRSVLTSQLPESSPGETVRTSKPPNCRCAVPRWVGCSSRSPQCCSRPVSMNMGGGRSGSPSGLLLGHSSIGSASRRTRPPASPNYRAQRDPRLAERAVGPSGAGGPC